jgi:hypothetical protein
LDASASGFFHINVIETCGWRRHDSQVWRRLQHFAIDSVTQTNPQNVRRSGLSEQAVAIEIGQPHFTGAA